LSFLLFTYEHVGLQQNKKNSKSRVETVTMFSARILHERETLKLASTSLRYKTSNRIYTQPFTLLPDIHPPVHLCCGSSIRPTTIHLPPAHQFTFLLLSRYTIILCSQITVLSQKHGSYLTTSVVQFSVIIYTETKALFCDTQFKIMCIKGKKKR
jgi:hypothetical protein